MTWRSLVPVIPVFVISCALAVSAVLLRSTVEFDTALAVAWVTTTGVGVMTTLWTVMDCWLESSAATRVSSRAMQLIASANLRREFLRLYVLAALCMIGAGVLLHISDSTVTRLLIISVALSLVSNSVLDRVERRQTGQALRLTLHAVADGDGLQKGTNGAEFC